MMIIVICVSIVYALLCFHYVIIVHNFFETCIINASLSCFRDPCAPHLSLRERWSPEAAFMLEQIMLLFEENWIWA
jgi:hypothetical protein